MPELVAVLAHEIGHYKMRHILQGIVIRVANTGVVFFLLSVVLGSAGLYDAFFMNEQSIYTGLLFFALLYTPVNVVLSVVMQVVSRKHEYEADRWSAETYEEPASLVKAAQEALRREPFESGTAPVLRISELLAPAAAEQSRGHREAQPAGAGASEPEGSGVPVQ